MGRKNRGSWPKGNKSDRGSKGQRGQHGISSSNSPKDLRRAILEVFRRKPDKQLNHKQVSSALGVLNHDVRNLIMKLLSDLATKGKLEDIGRGKYLLMAEEVQATSGVIQITRFGRGFVMQEDGSEIKLSKGSTGNSFWGDTVEVEWAKNRSRAIPYVSKVIQRMRKVYVVTIEQVKDYAFGHPSDTRLHTNFFIPGRSLNGAIQGDKVLVELKSWDSHDDAPLGHVVKVLGQEGALEPR